MKKIMTLLVAFLLLLALTVPVFADGYDYMVDRRGVLTDTGALTERAQNLYDEYGVSLCFLTDILEDPDECTRLVEEVFIPGETIPDAPAVVLVDGGERLFIRGLRSPDSYFREGVADAVFDAYEAAESYAEGVLAYLSAAESYFVEAGSRTDPLLNSRFVDGAGLVPDASDAAALSARLDEISARQACDVVIVTTDSLGSKTATEYADDYFDYNGYGTGEDRSGILFLISMEDRDWAISTRGYGIEAFTDYGQEQIMEAIRGDLGNDDFLTAFNGFADQADELLTMARNGTPLDVPDSSGQFRKLVLGPAGVIIALIAGFLISGIPMKKLKKEISNVEWKKSASDYTRAGSMQLTQSYENFLYANTSRTAIESDSGSRSGGGSSTHTSSSGATHGGSSGKF